MSNKIDLYAQATKLSLENAEQWIDDAKLLIKNSSYGHANALLRFACEEIAKAYVCWLSSERIFPIDNKVVKDVFRKHKVKNQVIVALIYGFAWRGNYPGIEPSDQKIIEAYNQLKPMIASTEKMRQRAIYVNRIRDKNQVQTPLAIPKKEANHVLVLTEILFKFIKSYIEKCPESAKEKFRRIFDSYPKEAWETGEIPIEWFKEKE